MTIQKYIPPSSLPLKVEAHEKTLQQSKDELQAFIKFSEGLVFGKIGLDGLLGLLPGVGGVYTGLGGLWLLFQCIRVRTSLQEKILTFVLTLVDIGIGLVPAAGDILDFFLRVHSIIGKRLIAHTNVQLQLIERTRDQLVQNLPVDVEELEDLLFRNGKTKQQQQMQYWMALGLVIFIFGGCTVMLK